MALGFDTQGSGWYWNPETGKYEQRNPAAAPNPYAPSESYTAGDKDPSGRPLPAPNTGTINPTAATTSAPASAGAGSGTGNGGQASTPAPTTSGTTPGTSAAAQGAKNALGGFGGTQTSNLHGMALENENVFGLRDNDNWGSWSNRAFNEATVRGGDKAMNPYLSQNPMANGPYQTWFRQRYGESMPMNQMVADLIGGQDMADSTRFANGMQGAMANPDSFATGNTNRAMGNLQALSGNYQKYMAGPDKSGFNPVQQAMYGQLAKDPDMARRVVESQLRGGFMNGQVLNSFDQRLMNAATEFNDNPNRSEQQYGTYFNMLMKMLGVS